MPQTECPKCHAMQARRVKQEGLLQKKILQKLGFYPWECRFCKATFVIRFRGYRKGERPSEQPKRASLTERNTQSVAGD